MTALVRFLRSYLFRCHIASHIPISEMVHHNNNTDDNNDKNNNHNDNNNNNNSSNDNNNNNNNNNNDDDDDDDNNRIERHNSRIFSISSLRRKLSHTHTLKWPGRSRVQIKYNTLSAYHMQHDVYHTVQRDRAAIQSDRVEILFFLVLFS